MSVDTTTELPQGVYNIDPVHSSVSFKLRRGLGTFRAGFANITGSYADGELSGEVPVDGIVLAGPDLFKEHMMAPDWFDVASHPTISWKSTSITAEGDKLTFAGELTLKGLTQEITGTGVIYGPEMVPSPNGEIEMMGIDITSEISAPDYGIGNGLGTSTTLEISLTLLP
jgi:polyisoprenoid-binding protein YceI